MKETLHDLIKTINGPLWDWLVILLIVVGLFFTIGSGFVQIRLFGRSIKEMWAGRRSGQKGQGITPFQAFVTGLASRVGVGNVAGVAIAIVSGGPGAVFWMWLIAFIGMASAVAESSLAQLFKVKDKDATHFRGGPAYYIKRGLKQPWIAVLFALCLISTYGFVFNAVQANSIAAATSHAWNWDPSHVGVALVILSALNIFGGIKRISRISESFVPLMALLYLLIALYITFANITHIPAIFALIFKEAFQIKAAAGGFFGAMLSQAMLLGIKRGLFSNEAGMGSAPNAAASSDAAHPVNQGLIQMLGVFVDTFVVCTCTALIILLSGVITPGMEKTGAELTQIALESQIGTWGGSFLAIILFMFAFSSIIGNYAYAESNVQFINNNKTVMWIFRVLVLVMVYVGAIASLPIVWDAADLFMGIMAVINLIAIVLLSPIVWTLLKDYTQQVKAGKTPRFTLDDHPKLQEKVGRDVW